MVGVSQICPMKTLPDVPGITIDGPTTRDIDDALHIDRLDDGWRIRVAIADVDRTIRHGTDRDQRARERVATRYFGTGNSPMLPRYLAEDQLSLWPGRERHVMVVDFTLGSNFETKAADIYEGTLRSAAKFTYDEIPGLIVNAQSSFHQLAADAKTLAMGMLAKRRDAGALVLYDLNNGWVSTEEGFLKKLESKDAVIGYIIIQEMMIRANAEVARIGVARGVPMLFRNHEARDAGPELEALAKTIQEGVNHPVVGLEELRKSAHRLLQKANYGSVCTGHFGLSLPAYLHFTSPIRRYADLVNHRQVKAMIAGAPPPYTVEQVEEVAQYINARVLQDQQATADAMKAKAEGRAQQAIDDRRLDGLLPKPFERAVKVEARSGEDASEAFAEGFNQRLRAGRVPLICFTVVLGEAPDTPRWKQLKHWVLVELWRRPEDAISVLTQGTQIVDWPPVEFAVEDTGPAHQKTFTATAKLGEREVKATSKTSKEAKQRAAVKLLALLADIDPPQEAQPIEPAPPSPTPQVSEGPNLVGALQEFAQKRGLPIPTYAFTQTGQSHLPVISCTCRFDGIERTAVATAKKDAKSRAAEAVMVQVAVKYAGHLKVQPIT